MARSSNSSWKDIAHRQFNLKKKKNWSEEPWRSIRQRLGWKSSRRRRARGSQCTSRTCAPAICIKPIWNGFDKNFLNQPSAGEVVSLPGLHVRARLSRPSIFLIRIFFSFSHNIWGSHISQLIDKRENLLVLPHSKQVRHQCGESRRKTRLCDEPKLMKKLFYPF